MMTREMVMELLATAGDDVSVYVHADGTRIDATVEDFEGFDDDWDEIEREADEDLIESIEERLEEQAVSAYGNYYRYFEFDGFTVVWGYASFDI